MTREAELSAALKDNYLQRRALEEEQDRLRQERWRLERKARKSVPLLSSWTNHIEQVINIGDRCVGVTANRGSSKATIGKFNGVNIRNGKILTVRLKIEKEVNYYVLDGVEYRRYPSVNDRNAWSRITSIKKKEERNQAFNPLKVFKLA